MPNRDDGHVADIIGYVRRKKDRGNEKQRDHRGQESNRQITQPRTPENIRKPPVRTNARTAAGPGWESVHALRR